MKLDLLDLLSEKREKKWTSKQHAHFCFLLINYIEILWHSPASSKRNSVRQNRCCDIYVIIILCTAQEGAVERLVTHLNAPRRVDVDKEF